MIALSALWIYLIVAELVAIGLLLRGHDRQEAADVALTAMMWPLYAAVVGGCAFIALCAICVIIPTLVIGDVLSLIRRPR